MSTTAAQDSEIPAWIKNNAGWWATDQIDDSSFLQGIQYLIKEGIMVIPPTEASGTSGSEGVPAWIKNNAGWWAEGQIHDEAFVLWDDELIDNYKKWCTKGGGHLILEDGLTHVQWCKVYRDNSIWEEKIRFFYDFPELVEMRDFIRKNL